MNGAREIGVLKIQDEVLFEKKKKKTQQVNCLNCRQQVTVELVSYGFGHVAICPNCGHLAYSGN